jgi:serine/threonine protein kinase
MSVPFDLFVFICVVCRYRAPEVILGDPAYSSPVDIWACGAILAEMITLSPILPGTSAGDQMSRTVQLRTILMIYHHTPKFISPLSVLLFSDSFKYDLSLLLF